MKFIALLILSIFISVVSFAQFEDDTIDEESDQEESKFVKSNMYYGGYMSLSFGTYTVIGLTPLVGYKVSPQFSVGTQFSYEYVKDKSYAIEFESSSYGISFFSRYRIIPQLYAHVEFSEMNYKLFYTDGGSTREWVSFLWLGGGYSQPVSQNTWFNAQILFDVINNEHSPYYGWEPYFSVGFGVGF